MNKQEWEQKRADIIAKFGPPEWDGHEPMNESARKLAQLKAQKMRDALAEKRSMAPVPAANDAKLVQSIRKEIDNAIVKLGSQFADPNLSDETLLQFDETEKAIIRASFQNLMLPHGELAEMLGVSRQKVTSVLESPAYRLVYNNVFRNILPMEVLIVLRGLLKSGDAKIALEMGRTFGFIKSPELDLNVNQPAPIQDVELYKFLKQYGDAAAEAIKRQESND